MCADLRRSDFINANNKVAEGGVHQPQSELCGKVGVLSYRNAKERRMAAKFKVRADVFHYFVMVVVGSGGAYAFTRLYGESDEVKESNLVRHVVHFPSLSSMHLIIAFVLNSAPSILNKCGKTKISMLRCKHSSTK